MSIDAISERFEELTRERLEIEQRLVDGDLARDREAYRQVTRRYMSRDVLAKLLDPDNPRALIEARKAA